MPRKSEPYKRFILAVLRKRAFSLVYYIYTSLICVLTRLAFELFDNQSV